MARLLLNGKGQGIFRRTGFLAVSLIMAAFSFSAAADECCSTAIFDPAFRTLRIDNPDFFMGMPVLRLNSDDRLAVSFDEIGDDRSYLRYRLVHCNSDWKPSQLVESEYIDGFNFEDIEDYGFSSNTFVHYVNYRIEIPSPGMRPLVSGNYLLQVFDRDDPDKTLLQIRFYVTESEVTLTGDVTSRTDLGTDDFWQQLSIKADTGNIGMINPYSDLKLKVMQNRRPETERTVPQPLRVNGKEVVYSHDRSLIFPASNEYRRFETIRADYPGMHADSVRFEGSNYHVYLSPDECRSDKSYSFDSTQKGRYLVREMNATDSDLGADYVTVHFSLDTPMVMDGDIYVDGDLTNNTFGDRNRMTYDSNDGIYRLQMPLKQGSYNYQYVVRRKDGKGTADTGTVEGNKYETLNEYNALLYLRTPGSRYDRLVGVMQLIKNF